MHTLFVQSKTAKMTFGGRFCLPIPETLKLILTPINSTKNQKSPDDLFTVSIACGEQPDCIRYLNRPDHQF